MGYFCWCTDSAGNYVNTVDYYQATGNGYGDIQLGIVLGAWLGPMRMALTLFGASLLSLLAWLGVSLFKGFDKDRAIPLGPFLSVAGIGSYIGSFYYPEFFHLFMIQ